MWLKASLAYNFMKSNPDYISKLQNSDLFPCASFYNIELDVPRLQFPGYMTIEELREMARDVLYNYSKRNSIYSYIQSQGPVAAKLTLMVYKSNLS